MTGQFDGFDLLSLTGISEHFKWKDAVMILGIQDIKGLSNRPEVLWTGKKLTFTKEVRNHGLFPNTMTAPITLTSNDDASGTFKINFSLRGSKSLNFLPMGEHTNIKASGDWENPSFNGGFLPDERETSDYTFKAEWNIPSFSSKIPQQWIGSNGNIYAFAGISLAEADYNSVYRTSPSDATVGAEVARAAGSVYGSTATSFAQASDTDMVQINFLPEVNTYQKTMRVAKYGLLIIILTFASLFFTEIIKKQRIHLIQYLLIGAAMALFYSLLLAISEHLGFNSVSVSCRCNDSIDSFIYPDDNHR